MRIMGNKRDHPGKPSGRDASGDEFKIEVTEIPQPKDGEVLLRTLYLSVDPYLRSRMNDRKSYVPPFKLNEVIVSGGVGEVIESRSPALQKEDIVTGMVGWKLYSVATAEELRKIDPNDAPRLRPR